MRIGIGYDVHKLVEGKKLILGGIEIEHKKGLIAHSDGDVLIHSIVDAMIGALALGDIGKLFPDTDNKHKDRYSIELLKEVYEIVKSRGYEIGNIDSVIVAEKPRMRPYIDKMRETIGEQLEIDIDKINIKASTTEKLGFEGREEGMSSQAVVLLRSIDN